MINTHPYKMYDIMYMFIYSFHIGSRAELAGAYAKAIAAAKETFIIAVRKCWAT